VMSRVDRAGRDVTVIRNLHDHLQDLGIPCLFAAQPVDTTTPDGKMQFHIYGVFAEWERSLLIERMRIGRLHTARNGGHAGGPPPVGYRVDDRGEFPVLVVDREPAAGLGFSEASLVERIFRECAENSATVQDITDLLNTESVPPPSALNWPRHKTSRGNGDAWSGATVYRILTNSIYKGTHRWGVRRSKAFEREPPLEVEAPELAIVSTEVWNAAQRRLKENARRSTRNTRETVTYLLGSGLIRCGACFHSYAGRDYKLKYTDGRAYACLGRLQHRYLRMEPCHAPILRAQEWEGRIWAYVERFARDPRGALDRLAAQLAARPDDVQERADRLTSALRQVEDSRKRAERLCVRGLLSEGRLEEELLSLEQETIALRQQLVEVRALLDDADQARRCLSRAEKLLANLRGRVAGELTTEEKRAVLQEAVREIIVRPGATGEGWALVVRFVFGEPEPVPISQFIGTTAS
jgi:site-specific DNA recombinase